MAKKRAYHIRSNQTTTVNGVTLPKLPTINDINVGELAINYKDGFETLSIRNDNDEIVTFATLELLQAYIENEAKLSENYQTSALTGDALALAAGDNLDTFAGKLEKQIEENELVISSALNDLNSKITNLSLPDDYEKSSLPDGQLDLNPGDSYDNAFSKLEAQLESDGLVTSAALNDLNSRVTNVENNPPELSSNYQTSTLVNSDLRLQPGENLDTFAGKLEKAILDDETITAAALNDLNRRKLEKITEGVSGNLVIIDSNGNVIDSGFSANEIEGTDTKNTAGSTNTSNKLYVIGAETLNTNPQTYSQSSVYIGTDGKLRSGFGINSATDTQSIVATENYVETAIEPKADKVPEVNHGTSDTTFTLTPNIMHIWGEIATLNLTLSADSNSVLDEYMFTFTCPSAAATNLTLPSSIKWILQPELLAGKTYQVSIVNGLAGYLTDDMPATGQDNIIETVKVNGAALTPDANKAVDITVPQGTVTSVTVNGSNYTPDANGLVNLGNISGGSGGGEANVIESVKVNGTALTVTNKAVDITAVPASIVTQDATHRFVSDTEKTTWNNKVSNVQADWNATSGLAQILNKPTIPAAVTESTVSGWGFTKNTGTITGITMNGASKGTSGVVDLGTVLTSHQDISGKANTADLATVATSGSYNDLTNKPTIPAAPGTLNTNNTTTQTASASEALSGTISLHKVAKTGSYNDLLNKPTIPTALADLTADSTHRLVTDTEKSTWNSKANDTGVVHLAGLETITGNKIIQDTLYFSNPDNSCYIKYYDTSPDVNNRNLLLSANDTVYLDSDTKVQGDLTVNSGTSDLIITEDGITTSVAANKSNNKVWNTNGGMTDLTTIYSGSSAPSSSLGSNGDIYIKTS